MIDMCAGSELRDTQGEILSVEGADISELQTKGRLNDNHGSGFFNSIGKVTKAKKIFKEEDCEDDRQKYYWNVVKAPYIYVAGQLYDDEDHPNARAAAAILRNLHKTDCPLQIKASVEGGVVSRGIKDRALLARTKIHSIALTFTPANNATLVEPINLDKSHLDTEADMKLIKSVMHLAETNIPSFRHIVRDAAADKIEENLARIHKIMDGAGLSTDKIYLPSKKAILEHALEKKIETNVEKINQLILDMVDEELNKGLKSKIAGAMLAGATALTPTPTIDPQAPNAPKNVASLEAPPKAPDHKAIFANVSKQFPMLGAIGMRETNGGERLDHKTVDNPKSLHHGHTAGGMFGMMPNQAAFTLKQDNELSSKYPQLVEAAKDIKKNHKVFTDTFNSDPQVAADFAISLYKRNKGKTKSDEQLAYSWLNGLKGSWNTLKNKGPDAIKNHWYVKDVMNNMKSIREPAKATESVKKALTAGYGGAGAPGGRVGGAVIQSESLEDGRGFKYITCDDCGKDQIYSKYQVKCRHCNKNFKLEKLASVFKFS